MSQFEDQSETPEGDENKKVFSYEDLKMNQRQYDQIKEQLEDEMLVHFNNEVQKSDQRNQKSTKYENILQNSIETEDDKQSESNSSHTFSELHTFRQEDEKKSYMTQITNEDNKQQFSSNILQNEDPEQVDVDEKDLISIAIKNLTEQITLKSTQIQIYQLNEEQENENLYFSQQQKLLLNGIKENSQVQTSVQINQSERTNETYLKEYQILKIKSSEGNAFFLQVAVNFLKYNPKNKVFQLQGTVLQDILQNVDINKMLLNSFISKGGSHYYFHKNIQNQQKPLRQFVLKKVVLSESSDYAFLESNNSWDCQSEFNVQNLDQFKIDLPDDFAYNLEDLDYSFIQNATQDENDNYLEENEFIKKQFLLVRTAIKTKQNQNPSMLIYSLQDTSKPIIKIQDNNFDETLISFFTKKNEKQYAFTLYGDKNMYEINYDQKNGVFQKIQLNDPSIQKEALNESYQKSQSRFRLQTQQIDVLSAKIDKNQLNFYKDSKKNSTFDQSYFISNLGEVRLIYPIQSQEKLQALGVNSDSKQYTDHEKVIYQIKQQSESDLSEEQSILFILYFNNKVNYENTKNISSKINKFLINTVQRHHKVDANYKQIFCFKNMIIAIRQSLHIDTFTLNQEELQDAFQEKCEKLVDKQNKILLKKVLSTFDFKNELKKKIYQNNYDFSQDSNFSNQYLDNFYINKYKRLVFTTHQKGFINDNEYIFNPNNLLIDLSQSKNEKDPFKLLKLYGQDVQDVKLLKYHTSQKVAVFFFHHRNFQKLNDNFVPEQGNNLSGVHFMVVQKIQDLKTLTLNKKPLIEYDKTQVFIPSNNNGQIYFEKINYNIENILKYEEDCDYPNWLSNQIEFEMVRDLGDPACNWIPFILYNKVASQKFETYFCFLNIEKLGDEINYQNQKKNIDFSKYLQAFKINYYQSENEKYLLKDIQNSEDRSYRLLNQSQVGRQSSLFSRSSDWQTGLFSNDNDKVSAKFQIGTNIVIGYNLYFIDIQEFLVTIDLQSQEYQNPDQKFVFQSKNTESQIIMQPIHFTHIIRSQEFKSKRIITYATPFENERFVPNIDDDGKISSTLVLLNNVQTNKGIFQIIDDIDLLKNLCGHQLELFDLLQKKLGQYVYVTEKLNDKEFNGIFSDGQEIQNIEFAFTKQFNQFIQQNSQKLNQQKITQNQLQDEFQKQIFDEFVYTIFEINDSINEDKYQKIKNSQIYGELVTQSMRQLSFQNQLSNQLFVCQTKLNTDVILKKYFNKNESTFWLFHYQKILLSTSIADFRELFSTKDKQIVQRYFQPRFILEGQNICNLDLKNQENEIVLRNALTLDFEKDNYFDFLENSIVYQTSMTKYGTLKEDLLNIVQVFDFNHYYNLQFDVHRYESIIEKTMQQGQQKLLSFIVNFLINNLKHDSFIMLITQDFPYLLFKTKVNINKFFNISQEEDAEIYEKFDEVQKNKQDYCTPKQQFNNLELVLYDPHLAKFMEFKEDEPVIVKQMNEFDGPFYSKDEICNFIKTEEQSDQENNSSQLIPVVYSFINFETIIRKFKIDKIFKKNILEKDIIQGEPKDIKQIDDLFVATMINTNQSNQDFMTSSTIEKIICYQYKRVQPIIKRLLQAYIFGFAIPFFYLTFEINYLNQKDDNNESKKIRDIIRIPIQVIASIVQIIFLVFEFADIRFNGIVEYLKDTWNLIDTSQFILYFSHLFIRYFCDQDQLKNYGTLRLFDSILQIIICIQIASRILQFIRYNDDYSYLVQMLAQVFIDVIPFLTVFALYIIVFLFISLIIGADIGEDGYSNLPGFTRILISVFRTSIGDIQTYDYGAWKDKETKSDSLDTNLAEGDSSAQDQDFLRAQPFAIGIIWITWLINIFFMVIVLANFLIAEVSVTFENVKNLGNIFLNREKSKFNQLIFQIEAFFGIKNEFSVMVFSQNKDFLGNSPVESQFTQLIESIKKNSQIQMQSLLKEFQSIIYKQQKSQNQNENQELYQDFATQEQIQDLKTELQELKLNQQNAQNDIIQIGISQEKVVIQMLKNMSQQRDEDRKLLQKLVQQQNLPLRAKDLSYDEYEIGGSPLKSQTLKFDQQDSSKKMAQSASKFSYKGLKDFNQ